MVHNRLAALVGAAGADIYVRERGQVQKLFEEQLRKFNEIATAADMPLEALLSMLVGGDGVSTREALIERFRLQFYELVADAGIERAGDLMNQKKSRSHGGKKGSASRTAAATGRAARIIAEDDRLSRIGVRPWGRNQKVTDALREVRATVDKVLAAHRRRSPR